MKPKSVKKLKINRKTQNKKLDFSIEHPKNSLVYDEQTSKFGRVIESKPGFLCLSLVSGGKLVREDLNKLDFVRQNRHEMILPEIAKSLQLSETEVVDLLNQIDSEEVNISLIKLPKVKAEPKPINKKSKIKEKEDDFAFAQFLPKGSTTDPVRDPNGYIKQNFMMMSNKQIASATGLSEHTIRRKLGEWGLKRKNN